MPASLQERNIDDLILRAAIWQTDHCVNWSMLPKVFEDVQPTGASKVALLTFDRMHKFPRSHD